MLFPARVLQHLDLECSIPVIIEIFCSVKVINIAHSTAASRVAFRFLPIICFSENTAVTGKVLDCLREFLAQ